MKIILNNSTYSTGDDGGREDDIPLVRESEVGVAVLRVRSKNTTPGPRGTVVYEDREGALRRNSCRAAFSRGLS